MRFTKHGREIDRPGIRVSSSVSSETSCQQTNGAASFHKVECNVGPLILCHNTVELPQQRHTCNDNPAREQLHSSTQKKEHHPDAWAAVILGCFLFTPLDGPKQRPSC